MKLSEALQIAHAPREAPAGTFHLLCGFTPLHLKTFLQAHLQQRLAGTSVRIVSGLYGDLAGNIARVPDDSSGAAIVLEWFDLDPRLGARGSGEWNVSDIAANVGVSLDRLGVLIVDLENRCPSVALTGPSLPPLPVFHTGSFEAGEVQLRIEARLATFLADIAGRSRTRILNRGLLETTSPASDRYDPKSHLEADFPYKLVHASELANHLADLLHPPAPLKGVISDLDKTFWGGILGEVGVDGVSWTLAEHTQLHGLYQRLLASLADSGVLVAISTKNDPALVAEALNRKDILIASDKIYPVAAGWGVKSESVARILAAWNISAGDAVFIDDSPMELEEVARAHPGIHCIRFPSSLREADTFIRSLRDKFRRSVLREEDKIRAVSVRTNEMFYTSGGRPDDAFLASTSPSILLDFTMNPADERALELVNKTNQFNLNGVRYSAVEWKDLLARPGAFLLTVSYEDKFGPLGKIAVLSGTSSAAEITIDVWVLSCRAFARRVEHQCLKALFGLNPAAASVCLWFRETERNGPARDFVWEFADAGFRIHREDALRKLPALPHSVQTIRSATTHG